MAETLLRDVVIGLLALSICAIGMLAILDTSLTYYGVEINESQSVLMHDLTDNLNSSFEDGSGFMTNVTDKEGFSATSLIGVDVSFWATIKLLFNMMFSMMGGLADAGMAIGIPSFITYGIEIIMGVLLAFLAVSALLRKDT